MWRTMFCLAYIKVCVVLSLSGCAANGVDAAGESILVDERYRAGLVSIATACVEARLAAPSTATFDSARPPLVNMRYEPRKNRSTISVLGSVDAQNHFGAMLRKSYFVTWTVPGRVNGSWMPNASELLTAQVSLH